WVATLRTIHRSGRAATFGTVDTLAISRACCNRRSMGDGDGSSDLAEKAARLASAGAVGASVAHELRNALAVAESSIYLARRDVDDREKLVHHLERVTSEIRRAQRVIGAVLGLARGEAVTLEPAS